MNCTLPLEYRPSGKRDMVMPRQQTGSLVAPPSLTCVPSAFSKSTAGEREEMWGTGMSRTVLADPFAPTNPLARA